MRRDLVPKRVYEKGKLTSFPDVGASIES
jgi:hypothetical protein